MINQSIKILNLLKELTQGCDHYYIEEDKISSIEEINGHKIYSHYKRINKKVDNSLLNKHINKDINLAISVKNLNLIVFEYYGKYAYAFGVMITNIASLYQIEKVEIIEYSLDKLVVYLKPSISNKKEIEEISNKISDKLKEKLPCTWRILPNSNRPDNGNLLILPREYLTVSEIF